MTTLLKKLLGIQHLLVTGFAVEEGALVMEVRPSWRRPRCSGCEQRRGRYDTLAPRRWRHLDFGGGRVYLRYGLRRVSCRACGVVAEAVPWCDVTTARFTTRFEDAVGFLVPRCDTTYVSSIRAAYRVLKPGGRFIVCNLHPIRMSNPNGWIRQGARKLFYPVDNYTDEGPREFDWWWGRPFVNMHRTLSSYISAFLESGFVLEALREPTPTDEQLAAHPDFDDEFRAPNFIIYELRKPA